MADLAVVESGTVEESAPVEATEAPSVQESMKKALEKVQENKTQKAAEKLTGAEETTAPNKASTSPKSTEAGEVDEAAAKRSEAAKKGAETKRKNAEAAKEAEAAESAKASEERIKDAEARAEKAEKAAEKATKDAEANTAADSRTEDSAEPDTQDSTQSGYQPPAEWTPEAKADWETTPETVRSQVERTISEMQQGLEKHKGNSEKWDSVAQFEPLAAQFNADLPTVLSDYNEMSKMMRANPIQGIQYLAERHGIGLTQLAEQVLGTQSNEAYKQMEANLIKTQNALKAAQGKLQGYHQAELRENANYLDKVRLQNPDFAELESDVMFMLKNHTGLGNTPRERLDNALVRARNMAGKPAPQKTSTVSTETVTEKKAESAETTKAAKTEPGAQTGGKRSEAPSKSARDSVKKGFARVKGR